MNVDQFIAERRRRKAQLKWRRYYRSMFQSIITGKASRQRTLGLTGLNLRGLQRHLARFFQPHMSWANRGAVWEIHHKVPCRSFDLTDPLNAQACFNWTNLVALPKETSPSDETKTAVDQLYTRPPPSKNASECDQISVLSPSESPQESFSSHLSLRHNNEHMLTADDVPVAALPVPISVLVRAPIGIAPIVISIHRSPVCSLHRSPAATVHYGLGVRV
jgi:hypothetical protein